MPPQKFKNKIKYEGAFLDLLVAPLRLFSASAPNFDEASPEISSLKHTDRTSEFINNDGEN